MIFPQDSTSETVYINGKETSKETFIIEETSPVVYEVLRVIDGVPLFLEDHALRFAESLSILNISSKKALDKFNTYTKDLIAKENIHTGNVKIVYVNSNEKEYFITYANTFNYPPNQLYSEGIGTSLCHAERAHPNAKDVQPVRAIAQKKIAEDNVYEVLLVNSNGNITEGSKSNVFFQKGNTFYTASDSDVLKGITRKYVIKAIENCGFFHNEGDISESELPSFESACISGTSPKVLPIKSVDSITYNPATKEMISIMNEYESILKEYIFTSK